MRPSELSETLPPRYEKADLLAEGAFGSLYRALDENGREVAVKILSETMTDHPEAAWQFASEFRRLKRLDHPAFPKAYDEGRTPTGRPFYSMELILGESPAGPIPAQQVRAILGGVADALTFLQTRGLVHGDLKPENLKLSSAGELHLLDVGLMAPIGQRRDTIQGTLEYLAPEAFRKAPIDGRSDLYALGVLGYQLWTGSLPFSGTPNDLVKAHLQQSPRDVSEGALDQDPELATLIMTLLAKDPAHRPAAASDILIALGLEVPATAESRGLLGGSFIGREAILHAWRESLAGPDRSSLFLSGGAGSGKSRALEELRCEAVLAGRIWLGAACTRSSEAPAAPLRAILRQALSAAKIPADPITSAWLSGQIPPGLEEMAPLALRDLLQESAIQALEKAAVKLGGLAIGLDDWHLAEPASRMFLTQALRRACPIAWVRTADAQEATPPDSEMMELAPLKKQEALELVSRRLGSSVPDGLAEGLLPVADGNPMMLDLLLEHLVTTRQLKHSASGWVFHPDGSLLDKGPSESLSALFEARYRHLSASAQNMLALLALALPAGDMPAPLLGNVLGLSELDLADTLDSLLAERLLIGQEGRFRLAIPTMADLLVAAVDPLQRGRWASALATMLMGSNSPADADVDTLVKAAWLALLGDQGDSAASIAGEAGRRMLTMSDPALAYRLLDGAIARQEEAACHEERLALVLPKAEAERLLDRIENALSDYQSAVELARLVPDGHAEAKALNGLAKCRQLKGDYAAALELVALADQSASREGDFVERCRAALTEARLRLFIGAPAEAIACCDRAAVLARSSGLVSLLAQALNLQGALLAQETQAEAALALLGEAFAIAERIGDRLGMGHTLDNLGNAYLALGDLKGAADAFQRYGAVCRELGASTEAISADLNQLIVLSERGDPAEALSLAQDIARRASEAGRKFPLGATLAVQAQAYWRSGLPAKAHPLLEEALGLATEIKNRYLEEHVRLYRLEAWLACGDLASARVELRLAEAMIAEGTDGELRLCCHRGELARQAGEFEEARSIVAGLLSTSNRWVKHRAHQILAEGAIAQGEAQEAADHAHAAYAIAKAWDSPWHLQADGLLMARAISLGGEQEKALAIAHEVSQDGQVNLYAQAGALAMLQRAGQRSALLGAIAARLMAGLDVMDSEARSAFLKANHLSELAGCKPSARPTAPASTLDLTWMVQFSENLALANEESEINGCLLDVLMAMTRAERGYLLSYEGGRLGDVTTRGLDYETEVEAGFSHSIAEQVLFSGEPVYLLDASADQAWSSSASVMALGLRTVICLPFATPDRILGVLYLDRTQIDPVLTPEDLALLASLTTLAASAVLRERARLEAEDRAEHQHLCAELGKQLAQLSTRAERLQAFLEACLYSVGGDHGFLLERDLDRDWFATLALAHGKRLDFSVDMISRNIADWVLEQQKPLTLLDTGNAEEWKDCQSVQALGLRTIWCLPAKRLPHAVFYLDASRIVDRDPEALLRNLQTLLDYADWLLREEG